MEKYAPKAEDMKDPSPCSEEGGYCTNFGTKVCATCEKKICDLHYFGDHCKCSACYGI